MQHPVPGDPIPTGLCGNREDHQPHIVKKSTLGNRDYDGMFYCHADQSQRLPSAAERRRQAKQAQS